VSGAAAYDKLSVKRPLGSLVSFVNISSITFQIILVMLFQILGFIYLKSQAWYEPLIPNKHHFKDNNNSMETTMIYLVSIFQYVFLAFVFSKGPPFRRNILSNCKLSLNPLLFFKSK
jgi:cation-transporting P-type ATPase 13A2